MAAVSRGGLFRCAARRRRALRKCRGLCALGDVLRSATPCTILDRCRCVLARTCTQPTRPDALAESNAAKWRRRRSRVIGTGKVPYTSLVGVPGALAGARNPSCHPRGPAAARVVRRAPAIGASRCAAERQPYHARNTKHEGPRHDPDAGQRQHETHGRQPVAVLVPRADARRPPHHWCFCDLRRRPMERLRHV